MLTHYTSRRTKHSTGFRVLLCKKGRRMYNIKRWEPTEIVFREWNDEKEMVVELVKLHMYV
jgi:hypothetical protein